MRLRPPLATFATVGALLVGAGSPLPSASADVPPAVADVSATAAAAPADATSLGIPLTDVRADGGTVATTPDGVPTVYTVTSGEPAHLVAAHAWTGEILLSAPLEGASSSYSVVAVENGDVYVSTNSNGHLYRLPWGSEIVEDLGQVTEGQTFAWDITEG